MRRIAAPLIAWLMALPAAAAEPSSAALAGRWVWEADGRLLLLLTLELASTDSVRLPLGVPTLAQQEAQRELINRNLQAR